jgi:ABC-type nitrate/sulfonate/bicarbonate transport system substrate-binding protein
VSEGSQIESINDIEGKRIGVKKGTSTHGGLLRFSEAHGLDLEDELIDLDPSDQLAALAAGGLDAIVASEPTPSQAEDGGYGRQLATLRELGNSYPILLVVNGDFAAEHPETVARVIGVLMRATQFIRDYPEEAAAIQSEITGLDPSTLGRAMTFHYYDVSMGDPTILSLEQTARFLKDIGTINEVPDLDVAVDSSYLEEAQRRLGGLLGEGPSSRRSRHR